jgi:hypothetical protein
MSVGDHLNQAAGSQLEPIKFSGTFHSPTWSFRTDVKL